MAISENKRFPDMGKTFVAILEYYAAKAIGDDAKDELKQPYQQKQERERLERVFSRAEQRFIAEFNDKDLCSAIINLPIADLPSLVTTVCEFCDCPTDTKLECLLEECLIRDYSIDKEQANVAVNTLMRILREELASGGPDSVREKLNAVANLQAAHGISELVGMHRNPKQEEDFDKYQQAYFDYLIAEFKDHIIRGFAPQVSGRVLSLPLEKVFLPLQAVEGRPALAEYAEQDLRRQAAQEVGKETMRELDWQQRFEEIEKRYAHLSVKQAAQRTLKLADLLTTKRAVLLGDPGSGKTTITRYITNGAS